MPRQLNEVIAHLRACIADGSIKTTLIQTEDFAALCDAAELSQPAEIPLQVRVALLSHHGWKRQGFEYYAAHYLVGSELTSGDLVGHMRSLAHVLKTEYDRGVKDGAAATEFTAA